ncbi:MAG: S24 family peptidase [bacterium]|jgi:phage repressor protein C with HTH and peptisase S24 domain
MTFFDRVKEEARKSSTTIEFVVGKAGLKLGSYNTLRRNNRLPRADEAMIIAKELGTSLEYLLTGENAPMKSPNLLANEGVVLRDERGREIPLNGNLALIPILPQKVAAGKGQELLDEVREVGLLPFLKRMLRGATPSKARALEVRGDSMTGIHIFDGDMVVFVPEDIRGDGIYVLRVGDELIVKRVEFDPISRKLRIMSENPRYPDRVESADGQAVEVVGKVYGWVHSHPY